MITASTRQDHKVWRRGDDMNFKREPICIVHTTQSVSLVQGVSLPAQQMISPPLGSTNRRWRNGVLARRKVTKLSGHYPSLPPLTKHPAARPSRGVFGLQSWCRRSVHYSVCSLEEGGIEDGTARRILCKSYFTALLSEYSFKTQLKETVREIPP
jgi:hypothetical protein